MTLRRASIVATLVAACMLPASAFAVSSTATSSAVGTGTGAASASATGGAAATSTAGAGTKAKTQTAPMTYDLSWTLPTAGKSGCTVCHSDKDLVRVQGGRTVSLYVNTEELATSAHAGIVCTGCHIDFSYATPHGNVSKSGDEWKAIAKSSCKNCHPGAFSDYSSSSHSPSAKPGASTSTTGAPNSSAPGKPRPLCGDCHGGHSIPASNNVEARKVVHLSGEKMCGSCHEAATVSFADYYHGAAYRAGAPDAPACWDCHSAHKVLPSTDRASTVHKDRLIDTCKKCHSDPRDGYVTYEGLVHGRQDVLDANPLYKLVKSATGAVGNAFKAITSMFDRNGS